MPVFQFLKDLKTFAHVRASRHRRVPPRGLLVPVLWLTNRCNLRCRMCDQWKSGGENELPLSLLRGFVDDASGLGARMLGITGGEALLREDVFALIEHAQRRGMRCHLCSNGMRLDRETVDALRRAGLTSISVSLDSAQAGLHDWLRGTPGCFDTVVENIRRMRERAPEIRLGINSVISKKNFLQLEPLVDLVRSLGAVQIKFDPIHTNLMHRRKNPADFDGLLFEAGDLEDLRRALVLAEAAVRRAGLDTASPRFWAGMPEAVQGSVPPGVCYAGYASCAIDPQGRVSVCDNYDGALSIADHPFREIWTRLLDRAPVHDCRACCWDTTHAELNLRFSHPFSQCRQIFRDLKFYR